MFFTKKKIAVVTGGTRGIGRAIALKLKECDFHVFITGTQAGVSSEFEYQAVDLSVPKSVTEFCEFLRDLKPDVLVNNAGINVINNFSDISLADFSLIQQVNITAAFQLCQAVLPGMREKRGGRIINIASIWSKISKTGRAAYTASKFALDGLTTSLAAEVAADNILVNCVSPGFIDTDLTRSTLGEAGMKIIAEQIPAKRLAKPEEIAALVAWLAGPENTYISGQNIIIDGGFTRV